MFFTLPNDTGMTNYIDRQLGNYRLLRLLGHGGFADIYLGEHIHLKTLAAIKMLHTQLSDGDREASLGQ